MLEDPLWLHPSSMPQAKLFSKHEVSYNSSERRAFIFCFASCFGRDTLVRRLSGGVTVAQGPLEAFVMVRIHAGQPPAKFAIYDL
jgi:hypothetical protein